MKLRSTSVRRRQHQASAAGALAWITIAGLLILLGATVFFFNKSRAQEAELTQLREQTREVEDLRVQVGELEQLRGASREVEQLRKDTSDLVKLRGEVTRLRALQSDYEKLQAENQQLQATIRQLREIGSQNTALRNQNQQLQGALEQQQQAEANAQAAACISNLRAMEAAKRTWAFQNGKTVVDTPTDQDLFGANRYIAEKPVCPSGGTYTLGIVQGKPTCTLPGHAY